MIRSPSRTTATTRTMLRDSASDGVLVALAGLHATVLLAWPCLAVVALGLWWNANTVSHNFVHRPFFRAGRTNAGFSILLSLLLGLPQSAWRDRHLAHHAGLPARIRDTVLLRWEIAVVAAEWTALLCLAPTFFLVAWLPGVATGLLLCAVHGHFEHVAGTTSHYGPLYNLLFLNDGFHREHHEHPGRSWRRLPDVRLRDRAGSRWPAIVRFLDRPLEALERLVLDRPRLQRFVLDTHRRAWRRLLPHLDGVRSIGIVGGGLFPRTAILLRELLPGAKVTIIDADAGNLAIARERLGDVARYAHAWFDPTRAAGFDLLVLPLDYRGDDKTELCRRPPARLVACHDWIWRRAPVTALVSHLLLKRINLHSAGGAPR